jgi:hypothetical protein
LLCIAAACAGCGTVKQTGTARTGTEQILLTNAWDEALQQVDFRPLTGVPVYLDTQHIKGLVDEGWIISSLRQAMLAQGVLVRPKPEQAQWIVEARVGAYGTDSYNWLLGIPQITMPVSLGVVPSGTIPEIPFAKKSDQYAYTKLALFAYDRSSGQMVWRSGTQLAAANAKDVYFGGIGPIQSGSIRQKNRKIGINLPIISDPTPTVVPQSGGTRSGQQPAATPPDYPAATMPLPSHATDLEIFGP